MAEPDILASLTGEETYSQLLSALGVEHEEQLPATALEIVRHRQVARVISIMENENLTIARACEKVGIPRRTFERWLAQDDVLQGLHHLAKHSINQSVLTALAALPDSTAHVARIAKGLLGEPRDALAASNQLDRLVRLFIAAAPPEAGEEGSEFEPSFQPLTGPRTRKVTIEFEGMKVTKEEGTPAVIEVSGEKPTVVSKEEG